MKVRLRLSYNEYVALVFIFKQIAALQHPASDILQYIGIREAEAACRKLALRLDEPPKKHYTVNPNSMQIILLCGFPPERLERYEQIVFQDIKGCIDKQYVSESHHRQMRIEAMFEEEQQLRTFISAKPIKR